MPPKGTARGSSTGAAKGKKMAKPKQQGKQEDPHDELKKEAADIFERRQPDGDMAGVLTLAEFAEVVREVDRRKLMLWGDDPGSVIRREWSAIGGSLSKQVTSEQFLAWFPPFMVAATAERAVKEAAEEAVAQQAAAANAAKYCSDGMWEIHFKDLKQAMGEAWLRGKTPLIIDCTEGHRSEVYFQHSGWHVLECKKMILEKAKGVPVPDILEEERRRLFASKCFEHGRPLLFRLGNTACDLLGAFNSESFPSAALLDAQLIKSVMGPDQAANVKGSPLYAMARDGEEKLTLEACGIHPEFSVAALTHFGPEQYEEFLDDAVPLDSMKPIKIHMD